MMVVTLHLPRPLPHQRVVLDDPSKRKVWRAGRRTGKSIAGMVAGTRGHGPRQPDGKRPLKGMLDGGNIAWVTKTYKQSEVIWRRLLKRFRPLEGVVVSIDREDKRIAMLHNDGALTVWSGHTRDALDNLRGDGYDGVLLDEAGYMDAEYAVAEVAETALLDTGGWLLVFSSTNAGWDGNGQRVTPSFLNRLCQECMDGTRPSWSHFHNRTEDNPRLDAEAVRTLRAEYPADSVTVQQEMDALLLAGGLLALLIDRNQVVMDRKVMVPSHWTWFAAIDWGYTHPWSFGLFAMNDAGTVTLVESATGRKQDPKGIEEACRAVMRAHNLTWDKVQYTVAGGDVFDEHGKSRGLSGPKINEQWQALGWTVLRSQASGSGKRVVSLNNLRHYLSEGQFRMFDTPENMRTLKVLESRITDPNDPEDVLKVDADADGRGGDDPFDMVRYGLFSRPITPKAPKPPRAADTSEGLMALAKKYGVPWSKKGGDDHGRSVRVPRVQDLEEIR